MNLDGIQMTTPGLAAENSKRQSEFNQAIRTAAETIRKADEALRMLAGDTERTLEELAQEAGRLQGENRKNWQAALKLTMSAATIHASFESDLRDRIADAETTLAKAIEATRKKLKAAGFDPKDSPHYKHNPGAVEAKFDFMVKTSDTIRAATAEVEQSKHDHTIWKMRLETISEWPAIVAAELQQFTGRCLSVG